jgi:hypothetical protein
VVSAHSETFGTFLSAVTGVAVSLYRPGNLPGVRRHRVVEHGKNRTMG